MEINSQTESESEPAPGKLFVGQIPKDVEEDALRVHFERFGTLKEVSIIRDNVNGSSKGMGSKYITIIFRIE